MSARPRSRPSSRSKPPVADPAGETVVTGKGRPTPKRREAEAANRRPLGGAARASTASRGKAGTKAERAAARAAARELRAKQYRAMQAGDERYMHSRDKGPVRRYTRNFIDARFTTGELFLPVALVAVAGSLMLNSYPQIALVFILGMYLFLLVSIIDAVIIARVLRKRLAERFGDAVPRGTVMYGVMRAFQMRRARMPRPQVRRGQHPD